MFKKPATPGYVKAASLRPYAPPKSWGSQDALESTSKEDESELWDPQIRPRATSIDSSYSFSSVTSK